MFIINTESPDAPSKKLNLMIKIFEKKFGSLPPHFKLLGTLRPEHLENSLEYLIGLTQHPTINPDLFAFLRLHIASKEEYDYCVEFNTNLLKSAGYDDDTITSSSHDISRLPFDERLKMLGEKAVKATLSFREFEKEDLKALYSLGWNDKEIYDVINHCGFMLKNGRLISAYLS